MFIALRLLMGQLRTTSLLESNVWRIWGISRTKE